MRASRAALAAMGSRTFNPYSYNVFKLRQAAVLGGTANLLSTFTSLMTTYGSRLRDAVCE